ncbi:MAG: hydroxymethylglutaryl-CoA synthase, partial [Myxococcota bacterium]
MPVGIEALAVYLPRHAIDLGALAAANGVEPSKYYKGLGGMKMAVVSPDEDPVTMAVSAAERLIAAYDVDPADIGLLIVGSESGVDCAKPIAAYVQGLLRLPAECRVFDTVHACYSATAALRLAAD